MDVKLIDIIDEWLKTKPHLNDWVVVRDGPPPPNWLADQINKLVKAAHQSGKGLITFSTSTSERARITANGEIWFSKELYDRLEKKNGIIITICEEAVCISTATENQFTDNIKVGALSASDPAFFNKLESYMTTCYPIISISP